MKRILDNIEFIMVRYFTASCILLLVCLSGCVTKKDNVKKRPNILFVISDDQSYSHTSFAGSRFVNTPTFDKLASEGAYMTKAYAGSPGCAPSRSSIVTGRHHWQNEQSGQHAAPWLKKYVPFTDEFKANGYAVGRIGKGVAPFQLARNENDSLWREEDPAGPAYNIHNYDENDTRVATGIWNNNYAENFKAFMKDVEDDQPFFLWVGVIEPHREFEKDSWKRTGKKLEDVNVPSFLPDSEVIRGDLLDYAVEIEWFDDQLKKILDHLEEIGELDNTLIIVTSDNGMAFPVAKAQSYEYGIHVPMVMRYPSEIPAGSIIESPIGFIDLAPTLLSFAGIEPQQMQPITGSDVWDVITGKTEELDKAVFSGRERHSSSRYRNYGYPQRAIRQGDYLLIWNAAPEREPAGAAYALDTEDTTKVNPVPVYGDIDASPTKSFIIENAEDPEIGKYLDLFANERPEFELYNVSNDPGCINNLAGSVNPKIEEELKGQLFEELESSKDPRVSEENYGLFDTYKRYSFMRKFPKPAYVD